MCRYIKITVHVKYLPDTPVHNKNIHITKTKQHNTLWVPGTEDIYTDVDRKTKTESTQTQIVDK